MTQSKPLATVIMAAGQGKRMASDLPKVLHEVGGRPMVQWVVDAARAIGADPIVVVVGHRYEMVQAALKDAGVVFAIQHEQLGTAHAVAQARPALADFSGDVLVLSGDVPGIAPGTIQHLLQRHRNAQAQATMLTAEVEDPTGYGRVIKNRQEHLVRVVEEKDASQEERGVREINSGIYVFDNQALWATLPLIKNQNRQNEYYLPDVLFILKEQNCTIAVEKATNYREILGVNTKAELRKLHDDIFT